MKSVLKNSVLVLLLFGFMALPVFSFGFASYEEPKTKPVVLGVSSTRTNLKPAKVEVEEQIEYIVSLGSDANQKIYNVLPSEYLGDDYQVVVSTPLSIQNAGVKAELVRNSDSADLVFSQVNPDTEDPIEAFRVILIVLK